MTDMRSIIAAIPVLAANTEITPLQGGNVNRTWLVKTDGRNFVLRVDTPLAAFLGLDRTRELAILRGLEGSDLAPSVAYADPASGVLLTGFIPGEPFSRQAFAEFVRSGRLAPLLARLWSSGCGSQCSDYAAAARRYADLLRTHEAHALAAQCAELAAEWCSEQSRFVLCHHDLGPANAIRTAGGAVVFVDWEYAGCGEPCVEAAAILESVAADSAATIAFARALEPFGFFLEPERLAGCRALYRRLSALWLMVVCQQEDAPAAYQVLLSDLRERLL